MLSAAGATPEPPGAATSTTLPKLEKPDSAPVGPTDETVMTSLQLAGEKPAASAEELPAETTTLVPRPFAAVYAACSATLHAPPPPRLRLMTSAGVALAGTPATVPPEAHVTASMMSDS